MKRGVRSGLVGSALLCLVSLAGCSHSGAGPQTVNGQTPDATLTMHQVQAAFIGSGNGGYGTLYFNGGAYHFNIGGLGVGGIGASTIDATGEVYHLTKLSDFAGSYVQGRYGFAFGTTSRGDLWLKNNDGVVLHLHAKRTGLMLSLGGDVVVIELK
ncbi:MAG TPA: hypothetical protein VHX12_11830 [Acidisoma sp.]|nr:hypothetical protein [Acidisoma sp.]